jgi:hypothetical protein
MNTDGMSVHVKVIQRSLFSRYIEPKNIMLEGMSFGCYDNGVFLKGQERGAGVVAYHHDHIGRGIHISCYNDTRTYELSLNLPSSSEEVHDFFQMTARLAKLSICEVFLNDAPLIPKKFKETRAKYQTYNLKLLHEIMSVILNDEPHRMSIGCVFHRLVAGVKEADRMWAGINTDAYRDWMHESQAGETYFSEARITHSDDGSEHVAMFSLPAEQHVIFPDYMELPIRFYDLSTGHPKYQIACWKVEILDPDGETVLGTMDLEDFRRRLPKGKLSYYDAAASLIEPLSQEELMTMIEEERHA